MEKIEIIHTLYVNRRAFNQKHVICKISKHFNPATSANISTIIQLDILSVFTLYIMKEI